MRVFFWILIVIERKNAVSSLIGALLLHKVAKRLHLTRLRGTVAGHLGTLFTRLDAGEIQTDLFLPLVNAVIELPLVKADNKRSPDVDIWKLVLQLIYLALLTTPPPSRPTSASTPITHSSASLQGREETRRNIEPFVFNEIRGCTHVGVEGFHEKYFKGKSWSVKVDEIWYIAQDHYDAKKGCWRSLRQNPDEDEACTWLIDLQERCLPDGKARYFRSTADSKVGPKTKRQIDLLLKDKSRVPNESDGSKHAWSDILVAGELKESEEHSKSLLLQLASVVRNVFANQPTRHFVHGFTLTGSVLESWVFDRSGPYSAKTFNIHDEPKRFIEVVFGYLLMDKEELGIGTFLEEKGGKQFVTFPAKTPRGKKRKFELDPEPIARSRAIVCRATTCFLAKPVSSRSYDSVVKMSWTSDLRPPETDLLQKANGSGVKGLAKLIAYQNEITSIKELRKGLTFTKRYHFRDVAGSFSVPISQSKAPSQSVSRLNGLSIVSNDNKRQSVDEGSRSAKRPRSESRFSKEACDQKNISYTVQEPQGTSLILQQEQELYSNRILCAMAISPAGRSISQFKTPLQVVETLYDAIKVHESLLVKGKILHRDISENNIIITDPNKADGFRGMLIDLDLAKEVGQGPSGARHRTGTMEFMAIEVLQGIAHTYRHDLEAFFYVLIWLCARRGWALSTQKKKQPKESLLTQWYTGSYKDIARNKRGDMDKSGLLDLLAEFPSDFDCVKPLCKKIRDILFPYKDGLFTGTPENPEILYEPILNAYKDTLAHMKGTQE